MLTVHFHSGMSNNERDFELCIRKEGVTLPKSGFFGISAATGGLAGKLMRYHDIFDDLGGGWQGLSINSMAAVKVKPVMGVNEM